MKTREKFGLTRRLLLILISLSLCLSLVSCGQSTEELPPEDKGIESGFYYEDGLDVVGFWKAACRSEKSVFDIDDVTLEFYYGEYFGGYTVEEYVKNRYTYDYYELYFVINNGERHLIRHVDENFVQEKHRCTYRGKEGSGYVHEIIYNWHEELTIPKELFTKEEGLVDFAVFGWGVSMDEGVAQEEYGEKIIANITLHYEKDGDTVKLTATR